MKDKKTTLTWSNMANNLMTDKLSKWRNLDWDKLTDYEKQVIKGALIRSLQMSLLLMFLINTKMLGIGFSLTPILLREI